MVFCEGGWGCKGSDGSEVRVGRDLDSSLRCAAFRMTKDEGAGFGMTRDGGVAFRRAEDEGVGFGTSELGWFASFILVR